MFSLFSCGKRSYSIDYCGQKDCYDNAKDRYKQGENVRLHYDLIATDTDYTFYLDGEYIAVEYDGSNGFYINFVMPEHDVKLECVEKNSMLDVEPESNEDVMLIDYYTATVATVGGDRHYELVLSRVAGSDDIRLDVYSGGDGEDEICVSYSVPKKAVDDCYELINRYEFRDWHKMNDLVGITGAVSVCRFRDVDGTYIRVSTESMPEDGRSQIDEIRAVIERYINDDNKI